MTIPKQDILQIKCLNKRHKRAASGGPWLYSNELDWGGALKTATPGSVAEFYTAQGEFLGQGIFNPKSLISGRILTRRKGAVLDGSYFYNVFQAALAARQKFFNTPYYRLIHAEADSMPGVIIDRFGDLLVVEINTAGMQNLAPIWLPVLQDITKAKTIYLKNDSNARTLEGLEPEKSFYLGLQEGPVLVEENNLKFYADIVGGQKTGWFYDQRANRAMVAELSNGAEVLDLYSYLGGFGLCAASHGAKSVTIVDRSEEAINFATQSAQLNKLSDRCQFVREDVFDFLESQHNNHKTYDVVIADPPAFAKSAKDVGAAKMGYRKLAHMSARVTAGRGYLFIASCSYHMGIEDFTEQVGEGLNKAGRMGKIIRTVGADGDHPVHLHLPHSAYLKGLLLQLD